MLKLLFSTIISIARAEVDLGQEKEEARIDSLFGLHPNELF